MNILLCTLGTSWAVIPESYALATTRLNLYANHPRKIDIDTLRDEHKLKDPDELWICTTEGDRTKESLHGLQEWWRHLEEPVPLRIWTAKGTDQLASQRECEHFRELVFRLTLKASEEVGNGQLLLSLAGGRKTMSADMQRAAGLFGAHRLLHVVDSGSLPDEIRCPTPKRMASALSTDQIQDEKGNPYIMPLVVGSGRRDELLDVETGEGKPSIVDQSYHVPDTASATPCSWPMPSEDELLIREVDSRERQGGALLGNYLASITREEKHENWRQLYRLPTGVINKLRETAIGEEHRQWLRELPKADIHCHLGGCLDLDAQKQVAQEVWDCLDVDSKDGAMAIVSPFLKQREWEWKWPERIRPPNGENGAKRSHNAAAFLLHASDEQLQHNLWDVTEPRIALKDRHPGKFAAYERPGELTGSAILQHEAAIAPYVKAIVTKADKENIAYLELRGSPQKYLGGDGSRFLALFKQSLDKELLAVREKGKQVTIKFVVIVDRRASEQDICSTVEMAVNEQDNGLVVGLDLAGDETHNPEDMEKWFAPAFEACLPVTIHAGEGQSAENIWKAAYHLHADRIGHGLTLLENKKLIRKFRDRGICLELCPSSNREVVGFNSNSDDNNEELPNYPLMDLWKEGLSLTVCTDNPGISRTDLVEEYLAAGHMCPSISQWEVLSMLRQGFTHAFIPSDERENLLKEIDQRLYQQLFDYYGKRRS